MSVLALATANLVRTPARTASRAIVLAAAVALVGAMILFVGHSLQTMTASATRSVPLDWQSPVPSYPAAVRSAAGVALRVSASAALRSSLRRMSSSNR